MSFLKPNFPKLLVLLAGVFIGVSRCLSKYTIWLFLVAVGLILLSGMIEKKEGLKKNGIPGNP